MNGIFLALALTVGSPVPAENYHADISPETAAHIMDCVISENDAEMYLDFNGDGELNIADYVGVSKRYQDNVMYGNEITLDEAEVMAIYEENFTDELLYWEIFKDNTGLCREYELTVSEITETAIYYEFEDYALSIYATINPFTECIYVHEYNGGVNYGDVANNGQIQSAQSMDYQEI